MAKNPNPKFKIRKDDQVVVIAGDEKGRTGRVLAVLPAKGKVVVEGINLVSRHVKATADQPGRIMRKEAAIHISNVALWNASEGRRVRVAWKTDEEGKKYRADRRTGLALDNH